MNLLLKKYIRLLANRDFLLLTTIIFVGQVASAFLVLALIASIFKQTGSSFGVSGVILSFAIPGFLLMAFAGLAADLFDRKLIILGANTLIALIVLLIVASSKVVVASISLAFLYFAGNSFFIPASSAATAQLVRKNQLLAANSLFIFALSGGVILGLFAASVISFFAGSGAVLMVCEILLIIAAILSLFLPPLAPRKRANVTIFKTLKNIAAAFAYIFSRRLSWFFFVMFALIQGIISFGITLAPGFFEQVIGLSVEKSLLFIFPLVGIGVILGTYFINHLKLSEGLIDVLGVGAIGAAGLLLGVTINAGLVENFLLLLSTIPFLISIGFGAVICLIASRTALQKLVSHNFQGTVFGANIILASFFSGVMSPGGAVLQLVFGYVNTLLFAGALLLISALIVWLMALKWKF